MTEWLSIMEKNCTSCRSCEIACSYHFKKTYHPESSKIKIHFNANTGSMKISIDIGCDHCEGEDEPLCVKYCSAGALILKKCRD